MKISQFAPVIIPTLNRYEHFKRCVDSLSRCTHAKKTDLYIALDFPAKDEHWDGYNKIKNFLKTIVGFKKLKIIERDKNYGAVENFKQCEEYIFSIYDRMIFTEDDNEFSPNFLDYINKGLDKYEDDPNVLAVCGYNPPIEIPYYRFNHYFYKRYSAWGSGLWREKYPKQSVWNYKELSRFMENKTNSMELKKVAERHYYRVMDYIKKGQSMYGDLIMILFCIQQNQYCVYPTKSKVRNHGHDGTGEHCGSMENDIYKVQTIDHINFFEFDNNVPLMDERLNKQYRNTLRLTKRQKVIRKLKKWKLFRFFNKYIYIWR